MPTVKQVIENIKAMEAIKPSAKEFIDGINALHQNKTGITKANDELQKILDNKLD